MRERGRERERERERKERERERERKREVERRREERFGVELARYRPSPLSAPFLILTMPGLVRQDLIWGRSDLHDINSISSGVLIL